MHAGREQGVSSFWFRLSSTRKKDEPGRIADGTLLILEARTMNDDGRNALLILLAKPLAKTGVPCPKTHGSRPKTHVTCANAHVFHSKTHVSCSNAHEFHSKAHVFRGSVHVFHSKAHVFCCSVHVIHPKAHGFRCNSHVFHPKAHLFCSRTHVFHLCSNRMAGQASLFLRREELSCFGAQFLIVRVVVDPEWNIGRHRVARARCWRQAHGSAGLQVTQIKFQARSAKQ